MPKALTDTQRVVLAHAAARDDRRVLPTPSTLNKNAGAIALSLRAILASALIGEVPAAPGDIRWGTAVDGAPTTLVITDSGFAAIGLSGGGQETGTAPKAESKAVAITPRAGSKLAIVIDRLRSPHGATIDELVAATGWQKHSVRGALSGALKTERKLQVSSELIEGKGRVYRIVGGAAADSATNAIEETEDGIRQ